MTVSELRDRLTKIITDNPAMGAQDIAVLGLGAIAPKTPPSTANKVTNMCSCLQYRQTKNCDHLKNILKEAK
jgi:hypothetical protein